MTWSRGKRGFTGRRPRDGLAGLGVALVRVSVRGEWMSRPGHAGHVCRLERCPQALPASADSVGNGTDAVQAAPEPGGLGHGEKPLAPVETPQSWLQGGPEAQDADVRWREKGACRVAEGRVPWAGVRRRDCVVLEHPPGSAPPASTGTFVSSG